MEEICLNCAYHCYERESQGWVCCNADSDYCADWTDADDSCEEFKEREVDGK